MGQLGCFEQLAFVKQVQPVWNVVVDRALPLAERIAARQAAARLLCGHFRLVARIDLFEFQDTFGNRDLFRLVTRELQELKSLVDHFKPLGANAQSMNRSMPLLASPARSGRYRSASR